MTAQLAIISSPVALQVPAIVADAGTKASRRFLEFFTANIRNPNTREAYGRAVGAFLAWCADRGQALESIEPVLVAAYVEKLLLDGLAAPSVKQHLAGIRMMFDYLVTGGVLPFNPAGSVRGPRHAPKVGKTPVLTVEEARALFDSLDVATPAGLRDRALLGVMVYSFGRVSAVTGMDVDDYYQQGKRWWLRLQEKGGKPHAVPVHHKAEEYLDTYLAALGNPKHGPLFRVVTRERKFSDKRIGRNTALVMVKRRCEAAGFGTAAGCHTFRATGITAFLENGGTLEKARDIAAHESTRTTGLYDRRREGLTLAEIERIGI